MRKALAIIPSKGVPAEYSRKLAQVFSEYDAVVLGDGTEFENSVIDIARELGLLVFLYRPYFKVDADAEASPRMYFTANRQKVQNCTDVLLIDTFGAEESSIVYAARRHAARMNKPIRYMRV